MTAPYEGLLVEAEGPILWVRLNRPDVLNAYTGENYGKFVVVKRSDGSLLAQLGGNQEIDQSITRTSVAGRIEHEITPGYVDYYIEEALLKAYCATMSFGYTAFIKQLSEARFSPHFYF